MTRMTHSVTRRGATVVESLVAAGIGLLALIILFGFSRSVHRHDTRLDAAATRIQALAHLRDALCLDLACVAAPEAAGRKTLDVSGEGRTLTVLTARRDASGVPRPVPVVWSFDPATRRLTRAGQPLGSVDFVELLFALDAAGDPAVTLTVTDARGPLSLRLPASESAAGLSGFVPAVALASP